LHAQVGSTRQNAFCERQDAFDVEFVDRLGVIGRSSTASAPREACRVDGCRW
jgi:hypothetical protein